MTESNPSQPAGQREARVAPTTSRVESILLATGEKQKTNKKKRKKKRRRPREEEESTRGQNDANCCSYCM